MSDKPIRGPKPPVARYTPKLKNPDDPEYATKSTLVDYSWKPQGDPVAEAAPADVVLEDEPIVIEPLDEEDVPEVDVEMEPID
jgi:hypothetical protein